MATRNTEPRSSLVGLLNKHHTRCCCYFEQSIAANTGKDKESPDVSISFPVSIFCHFQN